MNDDEKMYPIMEMIERVTKFGGITYIPMDNDKVDDVLIRDIQSSMRVGYEIIVETNSGRVIYGRRNKWYDMVGGKEYIPVFKNELQQLRVGDL